MEATVEIFIRQCAWCRKIKVDEEWKSDHSDHKNLEVTHGICPECATNHFPTYPKKLIAN